MFNKHDINRNECMLRGMLRKKGYDWWWHSFTGRDVETGEEKPFFIEYFLCNPALAEEKPVFGQLPENQKIGKRPSYVMVKAGCWGKGAMQLHRFFSWKETRVHYNAPYEVEADDCYASETHLKGKIQIKPSESQAHPEWMCDSGRMAWDIKVEKQIAFNVGYGASKFFRRIEAFAMFWHAEGMKSTYSGTVTCDGRDYEVLPSGSFGYADKNWGRDFTSPWVWLSSNDLVSKVTGKRLENSAFDIGGGRPKIYFCPLNRKLLGVMYYEGQEFDYNFSHFWLKVKTRFEFTEDEEMVYWQVEQENKTSVMKTNISCKKADMLLVNYEAPDGKKRHNRLWNGGNGRGTVELYRKTKDGLELIDELKVGHVGCEYGEYC